MTRSRRRNVDACHEIPANEKAGKDTSRDSPLETALSSQALNCRKDLAGEGPGECAIVVPETASKRPVHDRKEELQNRSLREPGP